MELPLITPGATDLNSNLQCAFRVLKEYTKVDDNLVAFVETFPLPDLIHSSSQAQCLTACCLGEILRLLCPDFLLEIDDIVDLFAAALPKMTTKFPEELRGILQIFQWYSFPQIFSSLDRGVGDLVPKWLRMLCTLAEREDDQLQMTLAELAPDALRACDKFKLCLVVAENPKFLAPLLEPGELDLFTEPENHKELVAVAKSCPGIVESIANKCLPLLDYFDANVRADAVEALSFLDLREKWVEEANDRDAVVRLRWISFCGPHLDNPTVLQQALRRICDPDESIREKALSLDLPFQDVSHYLVELLRSTHHKIKFQAFTALSKLLPSHSSLATPLLRFIAGNPSYLSNFLCEWRPDILDSPIIESLYAEQDEKAQQGFLSLVKYNCRTVLLAQSFAKAPNKDYLLAFVNKELEWGELDYEEADMATATSLGDTDLQKVCSLFAESGVLLSMCSKGAQLAIKSLDQVAQYCPEVLKDKLPPLTPKTPTYLLNANSALANKFPLTLVNPTPSILTDIVLKSEDSVACRAATNILYRSSPDHLKFILPEVVDNALQNPTAASLTCLNFLLERKLVRQLPVEEIANMLNNEQLSKIAARILVNLPQKALVDSVLQSLTLTEDICLALFEAFSSKKSSSPSMDVVVRFCDFITESVFNLLAKLVVEHKISSRFTPLLFLGPPDRVRKYVPELGILDVDTTFARLCYILAHKNISDAIEPLNLFQKTLVTRENVAQLEEIALRLKHYKLLGDSNHNLYAVSELASHILEKHDKGLRKHELFDVKMPADCFVAVSLNERERVSKRSYLDDTALAKLRSSHKRPRRSHPPIYS